jgi:hypothetical protein
MERLFVLGDEAMSEDGKPVARRERGSRGRSRQNLSRGDAAEVQAADPDRAKKEWIVLFAGLVVLGFCGFEITLVPPPDQKILLALLSAGVTLVLVSLGWKGQIVDVLKGLSGGGS